MLQQEREADKLQEQLESNPEYQAAPRPHVMSEYLASREEFSSLYKKLAK